MSFRNTIRSNSLDPDQTRCFVRPDLGPNCLQRLLADDKSHHCGVRVNYLVIYLKGAEVQANIADPDQTYN